MELFFSSHFTVGITTALAAFFIFEFWRPILSKRRKLARKSIMALIALIDGIVAALVPPSDLGLSASLNIAIFIPAALVLEILIFGHAKKWGTFVIFIITAFQFITLYSASLGATRHIFGHDVFKTGRALSISTSFMNIILILMLFTIILYRQRESRDKEINEIITSRDKSRVIFIYSLVNAVAVAYLSYRNIVNFSSPTTAPEVSFDIGLELIIRDIILFFSNIMILDFQSRNLFMEKQANEMVAKNLSLQKDMQLQEYINQGLKEKNKDLERDVEREKSLWKKLRRNVLMHVVANISTNSILDSSSMNFGDASSDVPAPQYYVDTANMLIELLAHPDHKEELRNTLDRQNLLDLAKKNEPGFEIDVRISPEAFVNAVALDDNAARIFAYLDRDYIWTGLDCSIVTEKNGDVMAYFYILDVDERKQQEVNIQKAATTDALTGLYNRRATEHLLQEYLDNPDNKGGALFMFDLDFFKSVNDNLGHPKGDELLKDVADILTGTFRSNDILCRLGGDEFCAFAKGFTDDELIIKRANLLNEIGRQEFDLPEGGKIHVSFSIGIAVIPKDATTVKELYACVDKALYEAKEAGRDCFRLYKE